MNATPPGTRAAARQQERTPLTDLIRKHLSAEDARALSFGLKINIYGLGLMALWNTVNTVILQIRVEATAPESLRGSALGLIGLLGVGMAALVQPFAGRASDAAALPDRRRPFIAAGTIIAIPSLLIFGWAPAFGILLLSYVVLQVATNIGQAAFQALIPDLVGERDKGIASGAKNLLSVVGAAIGLLGVRLLQALDLGIMIQLIYLAAVIAITAALTMIWVPEIPPLPEEKRKGGMASALNPRILWAAFRKTFREHATFRWAVIAQFLFLFGTYPAQRFLLFFLRDRFGGGAEGRASIGLAIAIVIAALAAVGAGAASDRIGRRPVLYGCLVAAGVGLVGVAFAPTLWLVALPGALLAGAVGAFQAVNWALLSDHVPENQAATAFGLANVATAGAGALSGIFGILVDVLNNFLAAGTWRVTFSLAALIAVSAAVPLHRISAKDAGA
jgi:MFS family permease